MIMLYLLTEDAGQKLCLATGCVEISSTSPTHKHCLTGSTKKNPTMIQAKTFPLFLSAAVCKYHVEILAMESKDLSAAKPMPFFLHTTSFFYTFKEHIYSDLRTKILRAQIKYNKKLKNVLFVSQSITFT